MMNSTIFRFACFLNLTTVLLISACGGGGSVSFPPERKTSTLSGSSFNNSIVNANVGIYTYHNGNKGDLLASGTTNEFGAFEVPVKAKSQMIFIEVSAGSYLEPATGNSVIMQEGQFISSVAYYETEKPLTIQLSPFTHLGTSYINFQAKNGQTVLEAKNTSEQQLEELFGIDVFSPTNETENQILEKIDNLTRTKLYEFFVAALSSFSQWLANKNADQNQQSINSITLINTMYEDLSSDGLLDGKSIDENNESIQLSVGDIELNAEIYRMGLAQHLLVFAKNTHNTSGINHEDLLPLATKFALSRHSLFGESEVFTATILAPALSSQIFSPTSLDDSLKLSLQVESVVDITSIDFDLNGEPLGSANNLTQPKLEFNSNQYPDGEYLIGVSVSDVLGNRTYTKISVVFDSIYPTSVSGKPFNGTLANANITIYAFDNGEKGERLATGTTDDKGVMDVKIKAKSQPVLVEASNGVYHEATTGLSVALQSGQTLSVLAEHTANQTLTIQFSPLAHIATSLVKYKINNGDSYQNAKSSVSTIFQEIFNVDVFSPLLLDDETIGSEESDSIPNDTMQQLYYKTLSSMSAWFAASNGHTDQSIFNTIELISVMSQDIFADGLLNGLGIDNDNNALPLSQGNVPLNANMYRMSLALHLMAYLKSNANNTGISDDTLLPLATSIAKSQHPLFGPGEAGTVAELSPILSHDYPTTFLISGVFRFSIRVASFVDVEHMTIYLDGELIANIDAQSQGQFDLNSKNYADGEHLIEVTVLDVFGNEAKLSVPVIFDNISLTLDTPLITNQQNITLSGSYAGENIVSISVNEQAMNITEDGNWSGDIALNLGENPLLIKITDNSGYEEETQFVMILDQTPPVIDSTNRHSDARFSLSDGTYLLAPLMDSNDINPLYFESNQLSLNGTSINRDTLQNQSIPFFGFTVLDAPDGTHNSALEDLTVELRYLKNDIQIGSSIQLSAINDEFLLPIVNEFLSNNWHQSNPNDMHSLQITAIDIAGNSHTENFSFRADIYVPEIVVDVATDVAQSEFENNATFDNRQNLGEFTSTQYSFTNTTGKSFYISLRDDNVYQFTHLVDEKIRQHFWRTRIETQWQAAEIKNAREKDQCPVALEEDWVSIDKILNYAGEQAGWTEETVPDAIYSNVDQTNSDQLPVSSPATSWENIEAFDEYYVEETISNISKTVNLIFQYDYVIDPDSTPPIPAHVQNWRVEDENGNEIDDCLEQTQTYFQQRLHFTNESYQDYPKNVSSIADKSDTFSIDSFSVFDNDTASFITPISGWYLIPAGHRITVSKNINTADINFYNDINLLSPEFNSYTLHQLDNRLSWTINNIINIETMFDAGEDNLNLMPPRSQDVGSGTMVYELSRE